MADVAAGLMDRFGTSVHGFRGLRCPTDASPRFRVPDPTGKRSMLAVERLVGGSGGGEAELGEDLGGVLAEAGDATRRHRGAVEADR